MAGLVSLLTEDAISLFAGSLNLPWGIYLTVVPVVLADNVTAFSFDRGYQISDFPVEQGGFASYNKVYAPFQGTFRFSCGGSLIRRQAFLDSIGAIIGDTNSYNLVTPNAVYLGVNIIKEGYQQTAQSGLGLVSVDVTARQVLSVGDPTLSSTLSPSNASQVNDGPIQTIAATAAQIGNIPQIISGFGF